LPRPKKRETLLAEAAIKRVIAEETVAVREELLTATRKIDELRRLLSTIAEIAGRELADAPKLERKGQPQISKNIPENLSAVVEPMIPSGPAVELDPGDALGEGRWV
jgi:hypothetical protein